MNPDEIAALKQAVWNAAAEAQTLAERDAFRTQTDFIGRMCQSFDGVMDEYDTETEHFPEGEPRETAIEGLIALAGLSIALAALLREPDPLAFDGGA